MSNAKHTIELPPIFYEDHVNRALPGGTVIGTSRTGLMIHCTDKDLDEIESDAKHYAWLGTEELGKEYAGLVSSARATVRRIKTYRNGGKKPLTAKQEHMAIFKQEMLERYEAGEVLPAHVLRIIGKKVAA